MVENIITIEPILIHPDMFRQTYDIRGMPEQEMIRNLCICAYSVIREGVRVYKYFVSLHDNGLFIALLGATSVEGPERFTFTKSVLGTIEIKNIHTGNVSFVTLREIHRRHTPVSLVREIREDIRSLIEHQNQSPKTPCKISAGDGLW